MTFFYVLVLLVFLADVYGFKKLKFLASLHNKDACIITAFNVRWQLLARHVVYDSNPVFNRTLSDSYLKFWYLFDGIYRPPCLCCFFQYIWACILIWRKKRCSSTVLWSLWSWLTVIISLTSCLTGLFTGWFLVNAALEVININHGLSSGNKVSIIFQNCSCSYKN